MRASDCRVSLLTWYGPLAPRCAETCSNMDDLLDGGAAPAEANMFESMETPAPAGDMFEAPAPAGNMFESMETPASEALPTFGSEPAPAPEMGMGGMGAEMFNTDMGPLAQWRLEREEKLAAKAAEAEAALKSKIEEAQGQIATFYADLKEKSEKRAQTNLEAESTYIAERDASIQADSWQTVCGMVDLKEKAGQEKDTGRMRQLLVQLKHT